MLWKVALLLSVFQSSGSMTGHTREISSIALSPDEKMIATGSVDLTVRLWDPSKKISSTILEGHDGEVGALAFSPDGKLLASGEMYKKVKIWDVATQKELMTYSDIEGAVTDVAFSPDSRRVFAATKDNSALVWTIGSSAAAKKLQHNWAVNGIVVSPDGKQVITIDDGGHVSIWDANTLKQTSTFDHGSGGKGIAISADGKTLVTCGADMVKIWDFATKSLHSTYKAEANAVAVNKDGTVILVGTQDNLVMAISRADSSIKWKSEKHERPVTAVALSADGKTGYSASMDRVIRIWGI